MDVPDLNGESLEIDLTGGALTVRGQRQYPHLDQETVQWCRIERGYRKFQRVFQLPKGLDPDTVTASIAGGVLRVQVPLPEAAKPHRIAITDGHQERAIESSGNWDELEAEPSENPHVEQPGLVGTTLNTPGTCEVSQNSY
jgi:HSP20 family protein